MTAPIRPDRDALSELRALAGSTPSSPQDDALAELRALADEAPGSPDESLWSQVNAFMSKDRAPAIWKSLEGVGQTLRSIIENPGEALKAIPKGIAEDFRTGFTAPVIGSQRAESDYLRGKGINPRPDIAYGGTITEATPGAVTPGQARRGGILTAANIGFAAAPTMAALPRVGTNVGLGALADEEDPLRGGIVGGLLGEVLQGATTTIGNELRMRGAERVLRDAIEEGAQAPIRRRAAYHPTDDTPVPTFGEGRLREFTPEQRVFRARLAEELGTPRDAVEGIEIRRRPGEPRPVGWQEGQLETQTFGGRVRRRPKSEPIPDPVRGSDPLAELRSLADEAIENTAAPEPIPEIREPVSVGGEPSIAPIASASPTRVTVEPSAKRAANKAALPEPTGRPSPQPINSEPLPDVSGETHSTAGVKPVLNEPITDLLNISKLDLDKTAQARLADRIEAFRSTKAGERRTWAQADVDRPAVRQEILNELSAGDPLAFSPKRARTLSGEQLVAMRDIVSANDELVTTLSKQVESGTLPHEQHLQAEQMIEQAMQQNDQLLAGLVVGSSQKGRDLNMLRRIANRNLDPDTWMIQAKRMLGDQPLTDEIRTTIRRLSNEAMAVCGGGR